VEFSPNFTRKTLRQSHFFRSGRMVNENYNWLGLYHFDLKKELQHFTLNLRLNKILDPIAYSGSRLKTQDHYPIKSCLFNMLFVTSSLHFTCPCFISFFLSFFLLPLLFDDKITDFFFIYIFLFSTSNCFIQISLQNSSSLL
jgi:hypothetical protein